MEQPEDKQRLSGAVSLQLNLTEQTLLECLGCVGCLRARVMPSRRLDADRDRYRHHILKNEGH